MNNKKLKVGLVIDDSLDSTAGVQQYVMAVGKWLTEQGHTVHYLTSKTERSDIPHIYSLAGKLKTRFNGNSGGTPLPLSKRKAKRLLRAEKYDVLHIQVPYSPFLAGQLISSASPNTAVIGTFHIFPESKVVVLATRALGFWIHRQLRRFDTMLSVSDAAKMFAKQTFRIDSKVLPNMFDITVFDVPPKKPADTVKIVFLGRLVPRKGVKELLEAVRYVRDHSLTNRSFEVIIGGRGSEKNALQQYVRQHNLENIVTFTGFAAEDEKATFLNAGDISVFPSKGGESFGISLLEAMAATSGSVIAGDNAGYRTVMGQEFADQLINPTDTQKFAELLAQHINDDSLRAQAQNRQRQSVKQYDRKVVCKNIESIYFEALQKRRV